MGVQALGPPRSSVVKQNPEEVDSPLTESREVKVNVHAPVKKVTCKGKCLRPELT